MTNTLLPVVRSDHALVYALRHLGEQRTQYDRTMIAAGDWAFRLEHGEIRELRAGSAAVLDRLYAAVRDQDWGTVPGQLSDLVQGHGSASFRMQHADLFKWTGTVDWAENQIEFTFDGVALKDFWRARIGFCLLQPAAHAGQECWAIQDERVIPSALPIEIVPTQPVPPFTDLSGLRHTLPDGRIMLATFEGTEFEMEDQRNWTDPSFKTFCTPLARPYPVLVRAGERIWQRVVLRLEGRAELVPAPRSRTIAAGARPERVGFAVPWEPLPFSDLGRLKPAHIRLDFDPRRAERTAWARRSGLPIELALYLGDDAEAEANLAGREGLHVVRVLALPAAERMGVRPNYAHLVAAARRAFPDVPIFTGTDSDFYLLNANPPQPSDGADGVCFTMNPQVHAFDDESILATAAMHGVVARSARRFGPVAVSVSFVPKFNPYSVSPQPREAPRTDPRLHEELGLQFTRTSLAALADAGVESATYFETHGPLGVAGSQLAEAFR